MYAMFDSMNRWSNKFRCVMFSNMYDRLMNDQRSDQHTLIEGVDNLEDLKLIDHIWTMHIDPSSHVQKCKFHIRTSKTVKRVMHISCFVQSKTSRLTQVKRMSELLTVLWVSRYGILRSIWDVCRMPCDAMWHMWRMIWWLAWDWCPSSRHMESGTIGGSRDWRTCGIGRGARGSKNRGLSIKKVLWSRFLQIPDLGRLFPYYT